MHYFAHRPQYIVQRWDVLVFQTFGIKSHKRVLAGFSGECRGLLGTRRNFEPKTRLTFEDFDKSIQKLRAIYKKENLTLFDIPTFDQKQY